MKNMRWLAWILVTILIDQVTKLLVKGKGYNFILNEGVAWGMGDSWGSIWVIGFTGLAIVLLVIWIGSHRLWNWKWALLVGGGLSNLVDRLLYGGVIDWITVVTWFPSFNVADMAISLSVIGLLFEHDLFSSKEQKPSVM